MKQFINICILILLIGSSTLLHAQVPPCVEDIDQQNASFNNAFGGGTFWQSFTCGETGFLTQFDANIQTFGSAITMNVYEGEGTGGTLLYSKTYPLSAMPYAWQSFEVDSEVYMTQGQIYSVRIGSVNWRFISGNVYTAGTSGSNAGWDFTFRSYISVCDEDGDGVTNGLDQCPGEADVDSDGDGTVDCLDLCEGADDTIDSDNDGLPDACDNCPDLANPSIGMDFDGSNDYFLLPDNSALNFTNEFTLETWIYKRQFGNERIFSNYDDNTNNGYYVDTNSDKLRFTTASDTLIGNTTLALQTWYHVAVVYSVANDYIRFYLDGVLDGEISITQAFTPNNRIAIGVPGIADGFYNGLIDNIRIWSVARSQQAINTNKTLELLGPITGLEVSYHLNEGEIEGNNQQINDIEDSSGNDYDALPLNIRRSGTNSNWVAGCPLVIPSSYPDDDMDGIGDACDNCPDLPNIGLDLDGINDYVSIPDNASLDFSNNFTLEAWIYKRELGDERIMDKGISGQNTGFAFDTHGSRMRFIGGGTLSGNTTLSTQQWYHVAAVYNLSANTLKLYLDGKLDGELSISSPISSTTVPVNIGTPGSGSAGQGTYNGIIDNVRIWTVARSQQEIQDNKNKELSGSISDLVVNFPFNEGEIDGDNGGVSQIMDKSGNGNNGSIVNIARSGTTSNWTEGALGLSFADTDMDGVGDGCDQCPGEADVDTDGDGILDCLDSCEGSDDLADADADAIPDDCDNCPNLANVALDFDGINDYVEAPDANQISLVNDFTFELWVKVTDFNSSRGLIGKTQNAIAAPFDYYLSSGTGYPVLYVGDGSTAQSHISSSPPNLGEWTHLAVVKQGPSIKHYLNGVIKSSAIGFITNTLIDVDNPLIIGSRMDQMTRMKGGIDEVRIWNIVRSEQEILDNYNKELTGNEANLVAYYKFNEGLPEQANPNVDTLIDHSTYANSAKLQGNFAQTGSSSNWITGIPMAFTDIDMDGLGDACDQCPNGPNTDSDNDGVADCIDQCPGVVDVDTDGDGVADCIDQCPGEVDVDSDGDGVVDCLDQCPGEVDTDSDGDGIADCVDQCPGEADVDTDGDGVVDCLDLCEGSDDTIDSDADEIPDACDNCPNLASTALDFDGVNDYVLVPDSDPLSITGDITIEAWIKVTDFGGYRSIVAKSQGHIPAPFDWYLITGNGRPTFYMGNGSSFSNVTATSSPPIGEWVHLAVVKSGLTVTHYLNGEENGSGNLLSQVPIEDKNTPLNIGSRDDNFTKMKGSMDQIRLWNMVRTQQEIQDYMNQEIGVPVAGLVANYNFDQGVPEGNNTGVTTLTDASGYQHDGTLTNFNLASSSTSNWVTGTSINFSDTDNDGLGDACDQCPGEVDTDTDGDGIVDCLDQCPGQDDTINSDGDALADCLDNCPNTPNTGLAFDGVDDYIDLGANMYFGSEYTVECWFKHPTVTGEHNLFAANANNILLELGANGAIRFLHRVPEGATGGTNIYSTSAYDDDEWHHLAAVKTANEMLLYIDGILEASASNITSIDDLVNIVIGKISYLGDTRYFNGSLDEYRIWNTARSQQEIQSYMHQELAGYVPHLAANYSFNEGLPEQNNTGLSNTLEDRSDNANVGILSGFTKNGTTSNWVMGAPINFADNDNDGIGIECDIDEEISNLFASKNRDDAFIELAWRIPSSCLVGATGSQFNIKLKADGVVIYQENLDLPTGNEVITGNYLHELGPDQSIDYSFEVTLSNASLPICTSVQTGTTLPFQEPTLISISDGSYPDKVILEWQNNSKLSDHFKIYRDGMEIANLMGSDEIGTIFSYEDQYIFDEPNSLSNGSAYNYCIETISDLSNVGTLSPQLCADGSTLPINFTASDDSYTDKVEMNWSEISNYCDEIQILRNGVQIASLINTKTSYADQNPIYGQQSTYEVVLLGAGQALVATADQGSVPPNGLISGKALTSEGLYPLIEQSIRIEALIGSAIDTVMTDSTGYFEFTDLSYGLLDSFLVSILPTGLQMFEEDSLEIILSNTQSSQTGLLFLETTGYEETGTAPVINSFTTAPDTLRDKVVLDWNYTPDPMKITYFNLFRNSTLIAQLNDSSAPPSQQDFSSEDLEGLPNTEYTYRLNAFYLENGQVSPVSLSVIDTFPRVTSPDTLIAAANATLGIVDLTWTHTSNNFNQFRIYRNDSLIANTTALSFSDFTGTPAATDVQYSITAYRTIGEADFESIHTSAELLNYPDLPNVNDLTATPLLDQDIVQLSFTAPMNLSSNYNYDGFRIYRTPSAGGDSIMIAELDKMFVTAGATIEFEDKTGLPATAYDYQVVTVAGVQEKMGNIATATFPLVSPPLAGGSSSLNGKINLIWQSPHTSENYDGFIIYRDNSSPSDSIGSIAYQYQNEFTDYLNNPPNNSNIDYYIKTLRIVNGTRYYSNAMLINSAPPLVDVGYTLTAPQNFVASRDIDNHIKLCWETGISELSDLMFELKREGTIIATLDRNSLTYYDYDAPIGVEVEYSIQILDDPDNSPIVFTAGQRPNTQYLSGRVYKRNNGQGIINVEIMATGNNGAPIQQKVNTDSSGYYQIALEASSTNYTLNVIADSTNSDFQLNPQQITISPNQNQFTLDFIDTFEVVQSDQLAQIIAVSAVPAERAMSVTISWSPDNGSYDGFEVFRGMNYLGDVLEGQNLVYEDTTGQAGVIETYNIRAFLFNGGSRVYSNFKGAAALFPALLPIENLTATPYIPNSGLLRTSNDNKVLLQWSHPYNNIDSFLIERNGEAFAVVQNNELLMALDTIGIPGALYNYAITVAKGDLRSNAVAISTYFPKAVAAENLVVTTPLSNTNNSMNRNQLSWEYNATTLPDSFEVYRNNMLLEVVTGEVNNYIDSTGIPNEAYTYAVAAMLLRSDQLTLSDTINKTATYATLAFPENRMAIIDSMNRTVELGFDYLYPGAEQYKIYRGGTEITTINDTFYGPIGATKQFVDETGTPDVNYTYQVEAITTRGGNTYVSERKDFTPSSLTYPRRPAPMNFMASEDDYNAIHLDWEYDPILEVDSFMLYKKETGQANFSLVERLDGGAREYTDIYNLPLTPNGVVTYRIVAMHRDFESEEALDDGLALIINTEEIGTESTASFTGSSPYTIAIDDDFAFVGNTVTIGKATRFEKLGNESWGNSVTINDPEGDASNGFGAELAAKEGHSIVGDWQSSSVYINPWDSGMGTKITRSFAPSSRKFGFYVDIAEDGNSFISTTNGTDTYIYAKNASGNFVESNSYASSIGGGLVSDKKVSISSKLAAITDGSQIVIYENTSSNPNIPTWSFQTNLSNPGAGAATQPRVHIASNETETYLLIGGEFQGHAHIYTYTHASNTWSSALQILPPIADNYFGTFVGVSSKGYAAISSYSEDNNGITDAGAVYVYKKSYEGTNNWKLIKKITENGLDKFGWHIDAYNNQLIAGAQGSVNHRIYQFDDLQVRPATNVSATQGQPNITIIWDYPSGYTSDIAQFRLYRSDNPNSVLKTIPGPVFPMGNTVTDDQNPIAGKIYTYKITAVDEVGIESEPVAAKGWKVAASTISGTVVTSNEGTPVSGVIIKAQADIDGVYYNYEAGPTGCDGTFSFQNMYFGDPSDNNMYELTPILEGHTFETLSPVSLSAPVVTIEDNTIYQVTGQVRHEDITNCSIEGVEVRAIHKLNNGTVVSEGVGERINTDENGNYTINIRPFTDNLQSIRIEIADQKTAAGETIYYSFESQGDSILTGFSTCSTFPALTELDFYDQTRYPVEVTIQNTCGTAITGADFKLRARSLDGCYEAFFDLLAINGTANLDLPPLDLLLSVDAVSPANNTTNPILNYLKNNGVSVDLYELHLDLEGMPISQQQIDDNTFVLTYHKPPNISTSGFSAFLCDEEDRAAIVQQGESYSLNIAVTENFDNNDCPVKDGFIVINNAGAAGEQNDTLYADTQIGGFEAYTFTAGIPNLVAPHLWAIQIEYYSDRGTFQGSFSQSMLIEGEVAVPGNDIIVDPVDNQNNIPLPLFVLHDPPGDKSYTEISQGQSFQQTVSAADDAGAGAGIYFKSDIEAAVAGVTVETSSAAGGSLGTERSMEVNMSTVETYSTSDNLVGRFADVIVGTGMAMQYGFIRAIEVDGTDCETIKEVLKLGFTPKSLETNWIYTVGFIEGLIDGYEADLPAYANGTKKLNRSGGTPYTKEEAVQLVNSWIFNWTQVLDYHDRKSNPLYVMCSQDYTQNQLGDPILLQEANAWRDEFCPLVGSGSGSNFVLDESKLIDFDTQLQNKYDHSSYAILNLTNPANQSLGIFELALSNLTNEIFNFNLPNDTNNGSSVEIGSMAKNYTLSGSAGAATFETANVQTSSKNFTQSTYVENSVAGGVTVNADVVTFVGLGGGIIKKILELEIETGVTANFNMNLSESRSLAVTNEASNIVVLDDDDEGSQLGNGDPDPNDLGDQFNVTILKSLAPNHTPYFLSLGGRASCPPEIAISSFSVDREVPMIQVKNPGEAAFGLSRSQSFVNPDQAAEFVLNLSNSNTFGEDRELTIFLDAASNPDGAAVQLTGTDLPIVGYDPSNGANPVLSISRGPSAYDYVGLRIGVRPTCEEDNTTVEYITINVSFSPPCSPATIIAPDNNWLLNNVNSNLSITIRDYVPDDFLEEVQLEYRRIESGATWRAITSNYLGGQMNPVSSTELATNDAQYGDGVIPEFSFYWSLPEDQSIFPDGDYELRVVTFCKDGDFTSSSYSNIVSGRIDRNGLRLFGLPEPADGIWTSGDKILATFNKNLNCPLMDNSSHQQSYFSVDTNGVAVNNADFVCLNSQIQMTLPDMTEFDGTTMTVTLDSVVDLSGNVARDISWTFDVVTQKLYWETDPINIELYEGETLDVSAFIQNIELVPGINFSLQRLTDNSEDWLQYTPNIPFSIAGFTGQNVTFSFTAEEEGVYNESIQIFGLTGNIPTLPIQMTVRPRPPYPPDWEVDGNQFPNSMNMTVNYQYTDENILSQDTMDQISVWIDGEQRALGKIQQVGEFHVAYLTIYGNTQDNGKALEFRVWDASTDEEYDAHPLPDTLTYEQDDFIGNTANPVILHIDKSKDLAQYIQLANGYTWFSLNTVEDNMSVPYLLRGLQSANSGDYILSQADGFAEYLDGLGWYVPATNGLDTLNTEESYMIYLSNGPDSLRITGSAAIVNNLPLNEGWTWVGYPLPIEQSLTNAITLSNPTVGDQFKSKDEASTYVGGATPWSGSLTTLRPSEGYKVKSLTSNLNVLQYTPLNIGNRNEESSPHFSARMMNADPNDPNTWIVNDYDFQDNIPFIAEVKLQNVLVTNTASRVAVFAGDEIRAVSNIQNNTVRNQYLVDLIIGKDEGDDPLRVYFWDASTDNVIELSMVPSITRPDGSSIYTYANVGELCFSCDCSILDAGLMVNSCIDGLYSFKLNVDALNASSSYNITGDFISNDYDYNQLYAFPGNSGDINITLVDSVDPTCTLDVMVAAPAGCEGPEICDDIDLTLGNGSLTPDKYSGENTLTSNSTIDGGTTVDFTAGQSITLGVGFHAEHTSTFTAKIEACTPPAPEARSVEVPVQSTMDLKLYPNPTSGITTFTFEIFEEGEVYLEVFDSRGQKVKDIFYNQYLKQGIHEIQWSATEYLNGIYFVILRTPKGTLSKRLIVQGSTR